MSEEKVLIKDAVDIDSIDYSLYGILFNMSGTGVDTGNTNHSAGDGWDDIDTSFPIVDTLARLGYTWSQKQPFLATQMEKHSHTEEVQLPIDQPIVLCIAKASKEAPKAADVIPVIIKPGYVFVLHRDTWHSASHGMYHDGKYHWMALVYVNEPTEWCNIEGGPIYVRASFDKKDN